MPTKLTSHRIQFSTLAAGTNIELNLTTQEAYQKGGREGVVSPKRIAVYICIVYLSIALLILKYELQ